MLDARKMFDQANELGLLVPKPAAKAVIMQKLNELDWALKADGPRHEHELMTSQGEKALELINLYNLVTQSNLVSSIAYDAESAPQLAITGPYNIEKMVREGLRFEGDARYQGVVAAR